MEMILGNKYRIVRKIKTKKELLKDFSEQETKFLLYMYKSLKKRHIPVGFDAKKISIYKQVKKLNEEIKVGTRLCIGRINSSCDVVEFVTKIEISEDYTCKIITNNGYVFLHDDYFIWTNNKIDEWTRTHIGYVDLKNYFIDIKKNKN